MSDWRGDLFAVKREIRKQRTVRVVLPESLIFKKHNIIDFSMVLSFFDWSISDCPVVIDFSKCKSPNYQSLALLVLFVMHLKKHGCTVSFDYGGDEHGASHMWKLMGAPGVFQVMSDESETFRGNQYKPLFAIRTSSDLKAGLTRAEEYCQGFNVEYSNTLSYVLSELLFNTLEHGSSYFNTPRGDRRVPSILQFTWYETRHEVQFLIGDLGVGVKAHLEQAYPRFESHEEALRKAIEPGVSGTFGPATSYGIKNNQGVGLYISSNVISRLLADMYIVSGDGVLHISPRDITSKTIHASWPGTFVLVSLKVEPTARFALDSVMQELRGRAANEIQRREAAQELGNFYLNILNYFGPNAEDKEMAGKVRDRYILPNLDNGKVITIDFDGVKKAPHSVLGALLATPIERIGITAYKRLRFVNCRPEIRETIDFVLNQNT